MPPKSQPLTLARVHALLVERKLGSPAFFQRTFVTAGFEEERPVAEYLAHVAADPAAWIRSFPANLKKLNSIRKPYGAMTAALHLPEVGAAYPGAPDLAAALAEIFGAASRAGGVVDAVLRERNPDKAVPCSEEPEQTDVVADLQTRVSRLVDVIRVMAVAPEQRALVDALLVGWDL
jgi:hypothetical protein